MEYRLSIFGKMDRLGDNHILFVVGNRKFNFKHKDMKVIHMLYFCYKKLLIRDYVDFGNKQLSKEILGYLEKIGFLIPYNKGNNVSSQEELKLVDSLLHNEVYPYKFTTTDLEIDILKRKFNARESTGVKEKIITSSFLNFILKRRSNRDYFKNKLNYNNLLEILQSGFYANKKNNDLVFHGVTASAGCFYEVECHIIIFNNLDGLKSGLYKYDKYKNTIDFSCNIQVDNLLTKTTEENFKNINCMLVFTGHTEFVSEKYGYKSYLYQSVETGLIQQNITLYCQQKGLGTCILGGYNNYLLRKSLVLDDSTFIYSTMFI